MVTMSSGSPVLDEATCVLVTRRALFKPAMNDKGKPTTGQYSNRIRWVTPQQPQTNGLAPVVINEVFYVETDGTPTDCRFFINGAETADSGLESTCSKRPHIEPFQNSTGLPVRKKVTISFGIKVDDPDK